MARVYYVPQSEVRQTLVAILLPIYRDSLKIHVTCVEQTVEHIGVGNP